MRRRQQPPIIPPYPAQWAAAVPGFAQLPRFPRPDTASPIPHPWRRRQPARPQHPALPRPPAPVPQPDPKIPQNWLSVSDTLPLAPRTSDHYAGKWVKQPGRRQSFLARYTGRPPPPPPARDGCHGGIRLRFCVNPTGHPVHRPTITQPRHAIEGLRGRRRPAAPTGQPTASHPHRGKVSGWPARQEHGLTLVGIHYAAGPASSLYVSYGPCSSVPASGCHHRAVPDDPTGLTEQALNLFLLAASPSGTRKTMTKSHALRSQAVAPTTWNPAARTIPRCPLSPVNRPSIINRPSTFNRQSSTANRLTSEKEPPSPMTTALSPPTRRRLPRCPRPPEPPA